MRVVDLPAGLSLRQLSELEKLVSEALRRPHNECVLLSRPSRSEHKQARQRQKFCKKKKAGARTDPIISMSLTTSARLPSNLSRPEEKRARHSHEKPQLAQPYPLHAK